MQTWIKLKLSRKLNHSSWLQIYILSLAFTRVFDFPVVGHRVQLPEIVFIGALFTILPALKWKELRFSYFDWGCLLLIGMHLLAALRVGELKGVLEVVALVYLYLLSWSFRLLPLEKGALTKAFKGLGVLAASLGIIGWFLAALGVETALAWPTTTYYPYLGYIGRAEGFSGHPSMLMSILLTCILFTISSIKYSQEKLRTYDLAILLIMLFGALLTFSKGLVLLCIGMILVWRPRPFSKCLNAIFRKLVIALLFLFYLVATNVMVIKSDPTNLSKLKASSYILDQPFYSGEEISLVWTSYAMIKHATLEAIISHPFLGIGPGSFNEYLESQKKIGHFPSYFPNYDPHSTHLGLVAEIGLVGGGIWIFLLYISYHSLKKIPNEIAMNVVFIAVFLVFLMEGMNTDNLHFRHYWVVLGVAMGRLTNSDKEQNSLFNQAS